MWVDGARNIMKNILDKLKIRNSSDPCETPNWDDTGNVCLTYASCGDPCEKPCKLCLLWENYEQKIREKQKESVTVKTSTVREF